MYIYMHIYIHTYKYLPADGALMAYGTYTHGRRRRRDGAAEARNRALGRAGGAEGALLSVRWMQCYPPRVRWKCYPPECSYQPTGP